ncbi:MAG TPA: DNA polymerase III subunit [Kiritimatiellia bacterium]|jgi:DNA polymerase-3 subunit delta'|nr:DNA polymerase III subunit [Kiritimatiellia bacterium]HOR97349.1 DNA polymerase III subunit [Kiritimatiellia bacterium]HPW75117.1 DNA polymerase III subunit [Kiritimatiellia bacterium]HRU18848.1 DNA polymerase III subunit [Kiritimatiellia bacterium]
MDADAKFAMVHRAIEIGHPAHGYLIVGPVRGAALTFAERILQTLFCRETVRPCGACEGCRRVTTRLEPDIHWIFPEKKSRIISVEQIRENLIREVTQTALSGGWKAGVLVGADRMNDASANTFLKTLEEPPEKTIFLLLCENPQSLLPTVVSRCQRIDLDLFRDLEEPWKSRVLEILASPLWGQTLENLALSSALAAILGEIKEEAERRVREETKQSAAMVEEDDDVLEARVSSRYREMRADFQLTLLRWYRDLMVLRAGGDPGVVFHKPWLEVLRERAARLPLDRTFANLGFIEDSVRQMERSIPDDTVLAYTLDRIDHGVV